jgi:hypothetical protein
MTGPAPAPVVTTPRVVLAALAVLCLLAVPLIVPFSRQSVFFRVVTIVVLSAQTATCAILAWRARPGARRRRAEVVALIAIAAGAAVPGYFVGPNAGFAALGALLVVAGGLVTAATDARASAVAGWWVYGALAGGQAAVVLAVLAGALPDRSLTPIDIPGHPVWHHVAAHVALQAIYLVAFVAARRFQRRYRALAGEVAARLREAARQRALVAEARADYARALARGKGEGGVGARARAAPAAAVGALEDTSLVVAPRRDDRGRDDRVGPRGPDELARWIDGWVATAGADDREPRAAVHALAAGVYREATGGPIPEVAPGSAPALPPAPPVPPPLAAVLAVGLAPDPADRFSDVGGAARALHAALAGVVDPPVAAAAARIVAATPWGAAVVPPSSSGPPRSRPAPPSAARSPSPPSTPSTTSIPPPSPPSPPAPPPAVARAWLAAYQAKMRGVYLAVLALCLGGAALFAIIIVDRVALLVAWAAMAAVVAIMALHAALTRRRPDGSVYWPWAVIGVASVGPAYALGLHSGFAAILAVVLFAGGLFRGSVATAWYDRRAWVLVAIVVAHTAVFALVASGQLADRGNVALRQPGAEVWEPYLVHGALLAVYALAFVAGDLVDRRQRALLLAGQAAAEGAARQEALLLTARAELDQALAEAADGIFTDAVIDHFAVGRLLGRGGMGEVYAAVDTRDERPVALKLVRGDRVGDPSFLVRFAAEAAALARVDSPRVARVYALGGLDRELPYIAMERCDGPSLATVLRARDRLGLAELAALVEDAARALVDLHAAGVIHRDVKPDNLIQVVVDGRWKLVDLGLAKLGDAAVDPTQLVGTPAYMAPEQVDGQADARADLYSLSLVLYRAAVGRPAFTGRDPIAIAAAARREGPPAPDAAAELPSDLHRALRIGLAAEPADRFADAAELAQVFAEALAGRLAPAWRRRADDLLARAPWHRDAASTAT